jgi:hypothetical protein
MSNRDELAQWLAAQPLDTDVDIDGESVYLRLRPGGAELGAHLWREGSQLQLQEALQQGFSSACEFDAGLGLSPDGRGVVLSQWLAQARGWADAVDALEALLRQVARWRAELAPPRRELGAPRAAERQEQRMRSLLAGGRR